MADSGVQMTVMSPEMAWGLGVQEHELLPVDMAIFAAGGGGLTVINGIPLMISLDVHGKRRETCHLAYVAKRATQFFVCKDALIGLELLVKNFPHLQIASLCGHVKSS